MARAHIFVLPLNLLKFGQSKKLNRGVKRVCAIYSQQQSLAKTVGVGRPINQ